MTIGLLVGRLFSFFWALYIIPLLVRLHYFCWEFSCYSYFGSLVTSFVARCFQDFLAFVSIVMCYLWFSLCLYYLEFVKLPACVHYCFPVNLGHVQLSVLFSFLLSSWYSHYVYVGMFNDATDFSQGLFIFILFLPIIWLA